MDLTAVSQTRLSTLLGTVNDAFAEVGRIIRLETPEASDEMLMKLRLWERKLLDLSLRNNLLNMRLGKNAIIYEHDDIGALEDDLHSGKEFILEQKELKGIYRAVRSNLEESGVNPLFLTLGTLVWNETTGGRKYEAPILLVPMNIVPLKKGAYAIRKRDEEVIINMTLIEMLKQQFSLKVEGVSPLPQDAHGVDVDLVLHNFRHAISDQAEWTVRDDSVLGIFSFSKFVMWNDIHANSDSVLRSPLIQSLVAGRLQMPEEGEATDARQMDISMRPDQMAVPIDADSSQLEAIAESDLGRSFILFGPPGTGKSQTITNIIANAMYHDKRVLFVAEKKAALEVVQSRLARIGLAPFCLQLHSNKMDKQQFLQQMQEALDAACEKHPEEFQRTSDALYSLRLQIDGVMESLHHKQASGLSLHDCINHYLSIDATPLPIPDEFTKGMKQEDIEALCDNIKSLDSGRAILGMEPKEHPLYGLTPRPRRPQKTSYVAMGDTLESMITQLPQITGSIAQQIERGKAMKFVNKTVRQYIESDYKWKKFSSLASVNDDLLEDIDALKGAAERWKGSIDQLPTWEKYAGIISSLESAGLKEALRQYDDGVATDDICACFRVACYRQMAMDYISHDPSLSQFNGMSFSLVIDKYRDLTREFQQLTRKELVARMSARIPTDSRDPQLSGELTLLRKRIASKGKGATIKNIIDQMPTILPRLCPVMLMSPLSVAQYINIDSPKFDLVVFDEASQIPTGEAVGAICRGKSIIIVGDPKQMPPTSFFTANVTDEDDADIDDMESILDDCISLSMSSRYLRWHYRSKHESLITFSNEHYYGGRLVTFPSSEELVSHVSLQYVNGFYDYGKTRTNKAEAEAIVEETIKRLQQNPERSIGIIAFSKQQSDIIEDLLEQRLSKYPEIEMSNREAAEPLFVKNLENVQGDERDVILFSIGYGPDKEGRVSMNFGPLNKAGGERRLNVAISRARYEMKIFSTLKPEQIDERRTQAEGMLGLKQFLKFAQNGAVKTSDNCNCEDKELVVSQLSNALRLKGYEVDTRVGSSAFRIDIAIVDPEANGRYALGIIIDGESYYRLKTARDREVIRPAVLRTLGWNLVHVWTLDWFLRSDQVIEHIINARRNGRYE
ncbi:MAG: DUF4011 domain-containing protein [Candidatus Cryptobacteroides sp.]|nr:DUF4011 domain-containing protein [Candidatus Cryptobacteroides sp.]